MAFKIDLEKVYDNVDYLRVTIQDFGFPNCIVDLIMFCISFTSLSILWNGEKLESFLPSRGLRQGDPMSPCLFVLCIEKLGTLIMKRVEQKYWLPIKVSKNGPFISHLLFVDDVLLFSKAKLSQIDLIMDTIEIFSIASGLRVNYEKSKALVSSIIPHALREQLASKSSIRFSSNLGKYLGYPLLQGRAKKSDFNFLIENLQNRLAS